MTEKEVISAKKNIDEMSQEEMASLRRFAAIGHIYFDNTLPISKYFDERFKKLGGFTAEISKSIGW